MAASKVKKVQQFMINGVTFPGSDKDQKPLYPGEAHYCDYFWVRLWDHSHIYVHLYICMYAVDLG